MPKRGEANMGDGASGSVIMSSYEALRSRQREIIAQLRTAERGKPISRAAQRRAVTLGNARGELRELKTVQRYNRRIRDLRQQANEMERTLAEMRRKLSQRRR